MFNVWEKKPFLIFHVIGCLFVCIAITLFISTFVVAGGLIDMGYGSRGESMLGDEKASRSKEPIQPIPISFDYDSGKVELGKKLFFEPRLSKSGWITCNSCHNLSTGGADNLPSSIGHKWLFGPINSPTVLNSRLNLAQFWDGRVNEYGSDAAFEQLYMLRLADRQIGLMSLT